MANSYKFFRQETRKWEPVLPERWQWIAYYNDKTELKQFGDDGIFHQFREIDQTKLSIFRMIKDDKSRFIDLFFNPQEMKLIHFYENYNLYDENTPDGRKKFRVYVFGFEAGKQKTLNLILPDDNVVVTDNIDKINFD